MLPIQLMLDSGAFNAYSRNIELDIHKYIAFVKRHQKLLYSYVNLDKMPNRQETRIVEQVNKSARLSYENLQRMKDAGLTPIPVVHQGEPIHWLEKMLDDGETYIGFSRNMAMRSQHRQAFIWLDECFKRVSQYKNIRTHGFGIMHQKLLVRYPWFSADSTGWVIDYGTVQVPLWINNKFDFSRPVTVGISTRHRRDGRHSYASLNQIERAAIEQYFKSIGTSALELANSYKARIDARLKFLTALGQRLKIKIFFATNLSKDQQRQLSAHDNRLLSFFDLMDRPPEDLIAYLQRTNAKGEHKIKDWSSAYLRRRYVAFIKRMRDEANAAE